MHVSRRQRSVQAAGVLHASLQQHPRLWLRHPPRASASTRAPEQRAVLLRQVHLGRHHVCEPASDAQGGAVGHARAQHHACCGCWCAAQQRQARVSGLPAKGSGSSVLARGRCCGCASATARGRDACGGRGGGADGAALCSGRCCRCCLGSVHALRRERILVRSRVACQCVCVVGGGREAGEEQQEA
jgi:hypothetical protein